jgi:hypothetical protein
MNKNLFNKKAFLLLLISALIVLSPILINLPYILSHIGIHRNYEAQAISDIHSFKHALKNFQIDMNAYPKESPTGYISDARLLVGTSINQKTITLTTPVAYISSYPFDPFFRSNKNIPYRYYSDSLTWFIIASNGPDQDIDVTSEFVHSITNVHGIKKITEKRFDPSNGAKSDGDIFFIGP